MSAELGLKRWHAAMAGGSMPAVLAAMITEDAVFHSPVVHTPQRGRSIVTVYLTAAGQTLGNDSFAYVRQVVDADTAMLEFTCLMDGIHVNGVDIIRFDSDGAILDFKVMVRPLKAVNAVWQAMAAQLDRAAGT